MYKITNVWKRLLQLSSMYEDGEEEEETRRIGIDRIEKLENKKKLFFFVKNREWR